MGNTANEAIDVASDLNQAAQQTEEVVEELAGGGRRQGHHWRTPQGLKVEPE